jgi:hypothetical protein
MKTVGAIAAAQIALMPLAGVQHISKLWHCQWLHAALLSEAAPFHICFQTHICSACLVLFGRRLSCAGCAGAAMADTFPLAAVGNPAAEFANKSKSVANKVLVVASNQWRLHTVSLPTVTAF